MSPQNDPNAVNGMNEIWQHVLTVLRDKYPKITADLWFSELSPVEISDSRAVLRIDDAYKRSIIEKKYREEIAGYLADILGFTVEVTITGESKRPSHFQSIPEAPKPEVQKPISRQQEYTFENFVVGSSNTLAHAACYAVASCAVEKNGSADNSADIMYNPLFIYGASGLGKTHLMYSIKNKIEKEAPNVTLIYIKGEEFTNQMVEAISSRRNSEFREKFRRADILIIDDIQFIANRPGVQEEIFHTFNSLYEDNKQIVFTSDKPPRDINPLEERLRTRFDQGLVADIQPPDIELRMAIIKQKAAYLRINVPNEVVTYLADRLKSNVRQVEGALKKIAAQSFLTGAPINIETTRVAISDLLSDSEPQAVIQEKILTSVSRKYAIPISAIKGKAQTADCVQARNMAIYLLRSLTDMSLVVIGNLFGRSHATVKHSLDIVEKTIKTNSRFADEVNELLSEIKG